MVALILLLMLISLLSILNGSTDIEFSDLLKFLTGDASLPKSKHIVLSEFRFPKLVTAILAGIGLSLSGLQMQTIFRNPLAGPYVLGISSGAGFGVALAVLGAGMLGFSMNLYGSWTFILSACLGAGLVVFVIFLISLKVKDIMIVLIFGILFSGVIGSAINILQYFSDADNLKSFVIWSMGSVSDLGAKHILAMSLAILTGILPLVLSTKTLDILLLGEHYAMSSGQDLIHARMLIFFSSSVLTGSVTAFCGPIGFVGVVVPHIARVVFQTSRHALLLPASAIIGALVIIVSDLLSHLPGLKIVLPLNSITTLIGIPIIIYILISKRV